VWYYNYANKHVEGNKMINQDGVEHIRIIRGEKYTVMHIFGSALRGADGVLLLDAESRKIYLYKNNELDYCSKSKKIFEDTHRWVSLSLSFPQY